MGKENDECFAVLYLPCSVIKPQQVLLSSHSHGYWKRETRNVVYAQASGLILMCFNPKMPIDTLARVLHWASWTKHIHPTQTEGNLSHNKSKSFMPTSYFCTDSQGWRAAHTAGIRVPGTGGHLPLSAATNWTSWAWKHRIPASSPRALGWACHGSLGGVFIIFFLPGCELMKHSAVAGVWWVPLEVQLSCPVPSQVKWQCSAPGALWWMLWRTGRKKSLDIFRDVDHILLQMKESMA